MSVALLLFSPDSAVAVDAGTAGAAEGSGSQERWEALASADVPRILPGLGTQLPLQGTAF